MTGSTEPSSATGSTGVLARLADAGRTCGGWVPLAVAGFLLVGTSQAFTVPYTGLGLSPAQLLLLLLGVVWLLTRLVGQRFPLGLGLLTALLVVRLCVVLISWGLGAGEALSPEQRASSTRAVLVEVVAAVLVLVTATLLRSARDVERVLQALVAGGALSGASALLGYVTGVDLSAVVHLPGLVEIPPAQGVDLVRGGVERAAGAAAQPLELAAVVTTLLPLAAACFLSARTRGDRAWPWALAGALIAVGGVVSLSRSVFVGLAAAGLVMASRWPLRRTAVLLAGVLGVVLAALASGSRVVTAVSTLLTQGSDDFSLGSREVGRSYVVSRLAEHPWFGQGPGTYDLRMQPVLDNQYLSQLVETGMLGLLASAGILVCALVYALQATTRVVDPQLRELATGLGGALVAVLVVQLVLDTGGFAQISTLTSMCLGLAAATWRIAVGPGRPGADVPWPPIWLPSGLTPGRAPGAGGAR